MADEQIEIVAPDGDVVLVVGAPTDPATCRKIQVSASTLAAISPVFKTLFGPHFREGRQARNASTPVEIPLPEDDLQAVLRLCRMAHMSYGDVNTCLSPEDLLSLAVHVDKYCCVTPLQLQCSALLLAWFQHPPVDAHKSDASLQQDLWRITSAAYLLQCPYAFERATSMLITHTWSKFDFRCTKPLPSGVAATIAEKRGAARQEFNTILPALASKACILACRSRQWDFMEKLAHLFDLEVWPPTFNSRRTTLEALMERARNLPSIQHKDYGSCGHGYASVVVAASDFSLAASKVAEECVGLCLACVNAESTDSENTCRKHKERA